MHGLRIFSSYGKSKCCTLIQSDPFRWRGRKRTTIILRTILNQLSLGNIGLKLKQDGERAKAFRHLRIKAKVYTQLLSWIFAELWSNAWSIVVQEWHLLAWKLIQTSLELKTSQYWTEQNLEWTNIQKARFIIHDGNYQIKTGACHFIQNTSKQREFNIFVTLDCDNGGIDSSHSRTEFQSKTSSISV